MINAAVRNSIRGSGRQAYPHQVARALPRTGLLLYLGRPNLEAADVPIGDDTEIGDDTIIRWMFLLPADADIRAATGWVTGIGNIFYDAAGDPVAVLASEIAAWSSINQWNVLFHLVSADTETGRLAIYAQDTPLAILNKALKVLREDQIDVSPSAFFNGMDTTGKTSYTGGPTYAPDHLGVLRSPGANLPAVQGMRLATTVADGAVLGPELVVNGGFDVNTAGWTVIAATLSVVAGALRVTKLAANGQARSSIPTVVGSSYLLLFSLPSRTNTVVTTYCQLGSVAGLTDVVNFAIVPGLPSSSGAVAFTAKSSTTYIQLYSSSATGYEEWDNVSIREIIPTYLSTDLAGAPIVASVEQKTRTGNADFSAFTPSTTFPRFDVTDPLKMPGLLCEPTRTNLMTQSQSLEIWAKSESAIITTNSAIAPDGTLTADKISTASGFKNGNIYRNLGIGSGDLSVSLFAKAGELNFLKVAVGATFSPFLSGFFNLITGQCSNQAWTAKALPNGWWYFYAKSTWIANVDPNIYIENIADITGTAYTGDGVSGVYVWGVQSENAAFPTSYIPTTTATATRAGTVLAYPTAGKIRSNDMAFRMIVVPRGQYPTSQISRFFSTLVDGSNSFRVFCIGTTNRINIYKTLANVNSTVDHGITGYIEKDIPLELLWCQSSTMGMALSCRKYVGGVWSSWESPVTNTTEGGKASIPVGLTYQLGAHNSIDQHTGNIPLFDTLFIPTGITDPLAWAKAQWGIA